MEVSMENVARKIVRGIVIRIKMFVNKCFMRVYHFGEWHIRPIETKTYIYEIAAALKDYFSKKNISSPCCVVEVGYGKCDIPIKKKKGAVRTDEEIEFNREVSRERIFIEHINRYIKRFRILSSRYRNKRIRFSLRATLICGVYNLQH